MRTTSASVYRIPAFFFVVLILAPASSVRAQEGEPSEPSADLTEDPVLGIRGSGASNLVAAPPEPTPRECRPRYLAAPATGVALGPLTMGGGAAMVTMGAFGERPTSSRDRQLIGWGTGLLAVGTAVWIYSAFKLADNRQTRQRQCGPRWPEPPAGEPFRRGPSGDGDRY